MSELDYPHELELEGQNEEGSRKEFKRDPFLFKMLPSEDKKAAENKLFFLAFNLNQFEFFKHWPEMVNYYAKLFVHWIEVADENGSFRRVMVACEPKMNEHAKSISRANKPIPSVFEVDECAFCDHAQLFWDDYREKRKAAGIENISKDEFKAVMAQHPEVGKVRTLAKAWGPSERYYFAVYDVAKALGQKALDESDEGCVRIQGYFGPDSIISQLYRKQKLKNKFWDFDSSDYRVVNVTRDNSRGVQFCEYFLDIEGEVPNLPGEVIAYLQAAGDIPDPTQWVQVWTPDQKQAYVQNFGAGAPQRQQKASVTPPRPAVSPVTATTKTSPPAPPAVTKPAAPPPPAQASAPALTSTLTPTEGPKRPKVSWR